MRNGCSRQPTAVSRGDRDQDQPRPPPFRRQSQRHLNDDIADDQHRKHRGDFRFAQRISETIRREERQIGLLKRCGQQYSEQKRRCLTGKSLHGRLWAASLRIWKLPADCRQRETADHESAEADRKRRQTRGADEG